MSDEPILLHNPRCSKSRAARALLEERGLAFRERRYLEDPLSRAELEALRRRLGRPVAEWIRRGEPAYAAAGLGEASSEAELLDAIAAAPILLERPIFIRGDRALVARPPTLLLDLVQKGDGLEI
jgi:arsenate reductase